MSDLNFDIFTEHGVISAPAFQKAVNNSIYLLNQFDAGILQRGRGALDWFVDRVSSNGNGNGQGPYHFTFHFVSQIKDSKKLPQIGRDFAPRVTSEFLDGVNEIETECETPPYLSESAMERVGEFGKMVQKKDVSGFRFTANDRSVDLTEKTAINVEKLTGKKFVSYGTIAGRLEELSIHGGFKARLYHENSNKVITCIFENELAFNFATSAFGKTVYVRGELHKNLKGDTIRIISPRIEVIEGRNRFSWEYDDDAVVLPSFVNPDSTAEYMKNIRGD